MEAFVLCQCPAHPFLFLPNQFFSPVTLSEIKIKMNFLRSAKKHSTLYFTKKINSIKS